VILKPGVGGLEPARSLVSLLQTAGLPEGLLELLPEDPAPARAVMDAGVDKVFFTGSHTIGATVLSQLAKRVTPSAMELSGCDAAIVRADADLGLAVRALTFGLRLNKGRTCIAPKRVFVARSIATEFEGRLAQALAVEPIHLLQGETQTRLRPIALQAIANGAHLLQGSINVDGTITLPLVFGGVRPSSRLLCEDFFAPVLSVVTVAEDAEAVSLANQCPYALGATVFTRDEREGVNLARQLRAGGVLINDMIAGTADPRLPFGGTGASGFGSTRGPEGLLEMTFPKVVTVRGGTWRMHFDPVGAEDLPLFHGLLRLAHGSSWTQKWRGIRELIGAVKNRTKK
jgi:aldehyde dehydrogenase (NAD+)